MKKNKTSFYLGLIILMGVCVQGVFLFFLMDPHRLGWPDPNHYLSIASGLAEGRSYDFEIRNLYRSPGYPFFLFLLIKIVGNDVLSLRLLFAGFYALFLYGCYLLGKEWKGEKTGLLLALFSGLYPYFVYIPLTLYPESFLIFISPWVLYLLIRIDHYNKFSDILFAGLIISWGTLTRPTYLLVPFLFFIYFVLFKKIKYGKGLIFLFLLIVPLFSVSLWGYRNYKVHGHFLISTAANINLFKGFNENTTVRTKSDCPVPADVRQKLSRTDDVFVRDHIYKEAALEFIKKHPGRSLSLAIIRMLDLWNPLPHTSSHYSMLFKILSSFPYLFILIVSVIGFYILKKDYFDYFLLSILIFNTAANGLFAVSIRYRVIFDIILIMYFSYFIGTKIGKVTINKYLELKEL